MSTTTALEKASGEGTIGTCHTCGCKGPNPGYSTMPIEEIINELSSLSTASTWVLSEDAKKISRKFICRNWQAAINAIQQISTVAEDPQVQHHPDIHLTNYRELELVISTHAVDGLTKYDFLLAKKIDELQFDYSPKWLKSL